jgi:Tol biopolymer transport system component/DNA-binding winged helix-turn-helix (wHTH) protein
MFLQTKQFYEFANFRLIPSEKLLLRDGKPVALTPKVFDTLKILTENAGHLLEKDELMKKIWEDRFVEEGNLAFNIKVLRKALGDSAAHPQFIETVPRRGYRFIAEVSQTLPAAEAPPDLPDAAPFTSAKISSPRNLRRFYLPLAGAAILLVSVIVLGGWFVSNRPGSAKMPILLAPFASEKLSTNGKVPHVALALDGKNMVYTNGTGNDKESVWLRQIETGSNVEIIPPTENFYAGLALSPDGNFLYFSRRSQKIDSPLEIYRVSIFGGVPQKIIGETQGWISISPDGEKISFVRCFYREDENCTLWMADAADGKNERKLVSRPRPLRIGDSKFAPDGKSIAFAAGQSENAANEFGLFEVNLETGAERELTAQKFFNIKSVAWFPDRSGLFITASAMPNKNFRIWQIAADGAAQPLTKDSETYSVLGLDKEATRIVSTQVKQNFRLRLVEPENTSLNRLLADASAAHFAPDGKIYFSSAMSGNDEIWTINPDGSGQKQLTNDAAEETAPVVAPDGATVFFASNRTGAAQVWRMNADGSNQTRLTQKEGGFPIFISPDGAWVYFQHGLNRTLWRVSTASGDEQLVLNKGKYRFAISPDGAQVAYSERRGDERILTVISLADRQPVKTFELADRRARLTEIVWLADGKSLAYITTGNEYRNNILWTQPLEAETPRQIAVLDDDEMSETISLAVSPNGKTFAVVQGGWLHDAVLLKGLR